MMYMQKTELMFSRPILKTLFWFGLFVLQSSSLGVVQIEEVKAIAGNEAKLTCRAFRKIPEGNFLNSYYIYWQKQTVPNVYEVAMAYSMGKEVPEWIHISYKNRTKMDQLTLTLRISPVRVSDRGQYTCIIVDEANTFKDDITLSVVADFSKPIIQADELRNVCGPAQLTLRCSSHGGYPKPKMSGFVTVSEKWDYTVIFDNQIELFNITGNVQINVTEAISVQCLVCYSDFQVSTNFSWSIQKCPLGLPPSHGIIIASIVILIFLVVVIVLAAFLQRHTCKHLRSSHHSTSHQPVATTEMIPEQQFLNGTSEKACI